MCKQGFRTFGAALGALNELLEDCGGFAGAADLLKIIEDFEKYGIIGVGGEEVLKVIKHYAELSDLIQHGLHYWKLGTPPTPTPTPFPERSHSSAFDIRVVRTVGLPVGSGRGDHGQALLRSPRAGSFFAHREVKSCTYSFGFNSKFCYAYSMELQSQAQRVVVQVFIYTHKQARPRLW